MPDIVFVTLVIVTVVGALTVTGAICYLAGRIRGQNDKVAELVDAILEERAKE